VKRRRVKLPAFGNYIPVSGNYEMGHDITLLSITNLGSEPVQAHVDIAYEYAPGALKPSGEEISLTLNGHVRILLGKGKAAPDDWTKLGRKGRTKSSGRNPQSAGDKA
jgi:hypothetical protein